MPKVVNPKALEKAARKAQRQTERAERRAEKRDTRGKSDKKKGKEKKKRPWWVLVLLPFAKFFEMLAFLLSLLFWGAICGVFVVVGTRIVFQPDIDVINWGKVKEPTYQEPLRIMAGDGSLTTEYGKRYHQTVAYPSEATPKMLVNAFIAAEDQRFEVHPGVDYRGIARAGLHAIKTGSKEQGASTITMQVARNVYLNNDKTFLRKIREIFISLEMEKRLTKDQIVEVYINEIFFGQRSYGVAAAAKTYYGKKLNDLTIAQMAMIAGLPKAPSDNNPVTSPVAARGRREYVLKRMLVLGYITPEEHEIANNAPVTAGLHSSAVNRKADYISEMVRAEMVRRFGKDALKRGFTVTTTVDPAKQRKALKSLRNGIDAYEYRHGYRGREDTVDFGKDPDEYSWDLLLEKRRTVGELRPGIVVDVDDQSATIYAGASYEQKTIVISMEGMRWAKKRIDASKTGPEPYSPKQVVKTGDIIRFTKAKPPHLKPKDMKNAAEIFVLTQLPQVDGALVSINSKTGEIEALAGGYDFNLNKWNRAVQARRQAGSSFKPFLYAAGLEKGLTPATMINDNAVVIYDPVRKRRWTPKNYNGKFNGPSSLRIALAKSMNLVSVRLLGLLGTTDVISYAERFGFKRERMPRDLSLSLGSNSLSPLELATGFAVFSNGGYYLPPHFIKEIKNAKGEVIFRAAKPTFCDECYTVPFPALAKVDVKAIGSSDEIEGATPEQDGAAKQDNPDDVSLAIEGSDDPIDPAVIEDYKKEEDEKPPVEPPVIAKRVISPQIAYQMRSMLHGIVRTGGTASRVQRAFPGRTDLGGKTGTTNKQMDAWFSGLNGEVVTTVWLGYNKLQTLGRRESGGKSAMPIWVEYMQFALKDAPSTTMRMPRGIVSARISSETGMRTSWDNPAQIMETFREEHLPEEDDFQPPMLDPEGEDGEEPSVIDASIAEDPFATPDIIDEADPNDPAFADDFDDNLADDPSIEGDEDGLDSLDDDNLDSLGDFGADNDSSTPAPSNNSSDDDAFDDGGGSLLDDL